MAADDDLTFQAVTWEGYDELSPQKLPEELQDLLQPLPQGVLCKFVVKVFGREADRGRAMCLKIHNFQPFFYLKLRDLSTARPLTGQELGEVRKFLSQQVKQASDRQVVVSNVALKDVWGFQNGRQSHFVQVTCYRHGALKKLHRLLSHPGDSDMLPLLRGAVLYESNLDPVLRLLHVRDLPAAGWISVRGVVEHDGELHCDYTQMRAVPVTEADGLRAPIRVAAFDIECCSRSGNFPVPCHPGCAPLAEEVVRTYETAGSSLGHGMFEDLLCRSRGVLGDPKRAAHEVTALVSRILQRPVPRARFLEEVERILVRHSRTEGDPVVQIGMTVHEYGRAPGDVSRRYIVTLGECDDVGDDVELERAVDEADLFVRWADAVHQQDPDFLTGYNIFGFDMPYMYRRMVRLGVLDRVMTRISRDRPASFVRKVLASSALGDNELNYFEIPGRTCFDLMKIVQRDHKLESYKLDAVAEHFTGDRKHDVSPNEIFAAWASDDEACRAQRARVALYCVQDCALCNLLVCKLNIVANSAAMANVCSVPVKMIHMRGQGIKLQSLVFKQCAQEGTCFPVLQQDGGQAPCRLPGGAMRYSEWCTPALREGLLMPAGVATQYEGATVLCPRPGVYVQPVCICDFASLYPSSMISENISHDTLVMDAAFDDLPGVTYNEVQYYEGGTLITCRFAEQSEGILPRILKQLLQARRDTRAKAKWVRAGTYVGPKAAAPEGCDDVVVDAFDDFQKTVLDGLQLAYKTTANSLYGQCGASTSPIYLKPLAACTTATGRAMIQKAKTFMEEQHAKVIYGDTDSVFVTFPSELPQDAAREQVLSEAIGKAVQASAQFKKTIKAPHDLEYEKTFMPFVIFTRKRYAAMKYEFDPTKGKPAAMGIVLKRRDNAPVVRYIYDEALNSILRHGGGDTWQVMKGVQDMVYERLHELKRGYVPVPDKDHPGRYVTVRALEGDGIRSLVISKALRKDYKNPQTIAHKVLADRVAQRDPGNAFQCNDRVPYVHVRSTARLVGDRIETPQHVLANGLEIDYDYYITNQIATPICQLLALQVEHLNGYYSKRPKGYFDDLMSQRIAAKRGTRTDAQWLACGGADAEEGIIKGIQDEKEKLAKEILIDVVRDRGQRSMEQFYSKVPAHIVQRGADCM